MAYRFLYPFLILIAVVASAACRADIEPSQFIRDDDKIKKIFSGMTFDGYHHKRKYEVVRYYAKNGAMYARNPKRGEVYGKWWVDDGKLCYKWSHQKKNKCRYISQSIDQTLIIKHRKNKGDYEIKFSLINPRPGNPKKFTSRSSADEE